MSLYLLCVCVLTKHTRPVACQCQLLYLVSVVLTKRLFVFRMTVFIPEKVFILEETVQEAEERMVSTACQTDPWVPVCSCAAVEKRSTGPITKELWAQLDCVHDHQCTTESCPYSPQMESEINEDHTSLYEPESSEPQSSQCEPRYSIDHFGGVGWCSENGEGAGHSTREFKDPPIHRSGIVFPQIFFYPFNGYATLSWSCCFDSLSTYECSAMKSQQTFAPEVLNCCTLYNYCSYYFDVKRAFVKYI